MECIEVGTDAWTAQLPIGWHTPAGGKPGYLESADGSAGVYFLFMVPRDTDPLAAAREVRDVALKALPDGQDAWQVSLARETHGPGPVDLQWDCYKPDDLNLIASRVVSCSGRVAVMSFHDYYCEDPASSPHQPHTWLASLRLTAEQDE